MEALLGGSILGFLVGFLACYALVYLNYGIPFREIFIPEDGGAFDDWELPED